MAGKIAGEKVLDCNRRRLFFYQFELFLAYAANRANPIIGNVLECSSGSDTSVGISHSRVVNPFADCAFVLFHSI